jgi:hypothetical protein
VTDQRSDEERRLGIALMTTQTERLRQEIKMENRKFFLQAVLALAGAVVAGIAIGRFWLFHS